MPYEEITEEKYDEILSGLKYLSFLHVDGEMANPDKYCGTDVCEIDAEWAQIEEEQKEK